MIGDGSVWHVPAKDLPVLILIDLNTIRLSAPITRPS
jgi:hypothetical protein